MTRTYRELDEHETAALQAFADAHGPRWRHELSDVYWYNARIWRGPTENTGAVLHGIRNEFGPTWLFDVCQIKPAKRAKPARAKCQPLERNPFYGNVMWRRGR